MQIFDLKVLFILIGLIANIGLAQGSVIISPKISLDVPGDHRVSINEQDGSIDVKYGVSLATEFIYITEGLLSIGGGIMYLTPREQKIGGSGDFNFVPIYTVWQLQLVKNDEKYFPSIIANIGYNLIYKGDQTYKGPLSLDGGIYFSVGFRVTKNDIFGEAMYKSFKGSATYDNMLNKKVADINYTNLSFGVGILL